jgi:flagellar biogenesis protein FliO
MVYGTAIAVAALILFGAARAFARRGGNTSDPSIGPSSSDLHIVGRTRVGIGRSLVIVNVDGRRLLLGSTRQQWTALADLGAAREPGAAGVGDAIEIELVRAMEASRLRREGRRP